jgi:methyl-accepting chemotaxis protein
MGNKLENIAETLDLSKRSSSPRMDEFGRAAIAFDALMTRVLVSLPAKNGSLAECVKLTQGGS